MRPEEVWENMGTVRASTRQTMPKTRMPFDGECITDLQILKEDGTIFLAAPLATGFDLGKKIGRFEDISLTWPTCQVVLWSDHKPMPTRNFAVRGEIVRIRQLRIQRCRRIPICGNLVGPLYRYEFFPSCRSEEHTSELQS